MVEYLKTQPKVEFEVQENGIPPRESGECEDSDTAALRQAGKSPVLKVCLRILLISVGVPSI